MRGVTIAMATLGSLFVASSARAQQYPPGHAGSSNMHVIAHIPMGSHVRTGDVEIEQELSRPYAYINTRKPIIASAPPGWSASRRRASAFSPR